MTDTYRITATVRRELARKPEQEDVGRPMSLKWFAAVWLLLLIAGVSGMVYMDLI